MSRYSRISEDELRVYEDKVRGAQRGEATPGGTSGGDRKTDVAGRTADPTSRPLYRSKWEAAYANKLDLEQRAGIIKQWWYEPFSLWLPGKVRYKPDFMVQYVAPAEYYAALELIEVKGWSKNRRDGMTRLKIAAALFPCFVWRLVWMKKGGGFDGEYI
jgi:hypothetical protein